MILSIEEGREHLLSDDYMPRNLLGCFTDIPRFASFNPYEPKAINISMFINRGKV